MRSGYVTIPAQVIAAETDRAIRLLSKGWLPKSQVSWKVMQVEGEQCPLLRFTDKGRVIQRRAVDITMPTWLARKHFPVTMLALLQDARASQAIAREAATQLAMLSDQSDDVTTGGNE